METVSKKENRGELFWEVAKKEQKGHGGRGDTRKWRNGLGDNIYYCNVVPTGNVMCSLCHVSQTCEMNSEKADFCLRI